MSIFTNIKHNSENRSQLESVSEVSVDKKLGQEKVEIEQAELRDIKDGSSVEVTQQDKADDSVSISTASLNNAQIAVDKDIIEIKQVLEEGKELNDAYARLSFVEQEKFRKQGENIVLMIKELLNSAHINVQKIFKLILEWLKKLPGINNFFLEQEAKIKTDKMLKIKKID